MKISTGRKTRKAYTHTNFRAKRIIERASEEGIGMLIQVFRKAEGKAYQTNTFRNSRNPRGPFFGPRKIDHFLKIKKKKGRARYSRKCMMGGSLQQDFVVNNEKEKKKVHKGSPTRRGEYCGVDETRERSRKLGKKRGNFLRALTIKQKKRKGKVPNNDDNDEEKTQVPLKSS